MEEVLESLSQTSGIIGGLIAGRDGLVIASHLKGGKDASYIGATVADLYRNLEGASEQLDSGKLEMITLERNSDNVFLYSIQDGQTILVVLAEPKINLGLVRIEIRDAAERLKSFL